MIGISASAQYKATKIVAHKGYHQRNGAPSNSIAALKCAQKEKFDMVEFDVNMTSDGELLVLHGDWHPNSKAANKVHVQYGTKSEILSIPLANGEKVPTFEEWIAQAAKSKKTKLLIEIKGHDSPALDTEVVEKIQVVLTKYNMQDKVCYLVGHEFLARELVRLTPKGTPIAITNNYYSPAYCHSIGCKIAGRSYGSWRKNGHLLKQARDLGLETMVWTVNKPEDIEWCIQQGFDYVLTDNPMMMREILKTTKR
jgi:glycerophosphoryl diester phosphodiesterase